MAVRDLSVIILLSTALLIHQIFDQCVDATVSGEANIPRKSSPKCTLKEWLKFKHKFNKTYSKVEDDRRKLIYCETKQYINLYNLHNPQNSALHLNGLSDRSPDEINKLRSTWPKIKQQTPTDHKTLVPNFKGSTIFNKSYEDGETSEFLNWASFKNIVGEIRDQGECGACWAFSTVALLESRQHKHNESLTEVIPLSPQQLVDCDYRSKGCAGGNIRKAYNYIMKVGGLETDKDYPYISEAGYENKCTFDSSKIHPSTRDIGDLEELSLGNDEELLKKILVKYGPIDVSIEANEPFIYASDNIIYDSSCQPFGRNHEVLLVGYGTREEGDYWIVRNSWGKNWGKQGYGLMARNRNNNCNIATDAVILND